MKKEILLYDYVYSYSTADVISKMDEYKDDDIVLRVNSKGGEVYAAYGIMAKFLEHQNSKIIRVDGIAASMGAFLCCAADSVECLDVSTFLFHRASMGSWFENQPELFTAELRQQLTSMNAQLRALMEGRFTAEKWEKVTKTTLDDLFSLESRIDVTLTAKQAKALGLVSKINPITPEKKAEIESLVMGFAAMTIPEVPKAEIPTPKITVQKQNIKMNIQQLKADHPEVYEAVYNLGVTAEKDRVEAYLEFADVDPVAVKAGIAEGKQITAKEMAAFSRKAIAQATLNTMEAENPAEIKTAEVPADGKTTPVAEAKAMADFDNEWKLQAGVSVPKA